MSELDLFLLKQTTEKTRNALERLVAGKVAAAMPVRHAEKQAPAQYIRYVYDFLVFIDTVLLNFHSCLSSLNC